MQISVLHKTHYSYGAVVTYSAQRLRLTPSEYDGQAVIDWSIDAPGMDGAVSSLDGFGNQVHLLTVVGEHSELTITARGEVTTSDTAGVVTGLACAVPDYIFLRETDLTVPNQDLRDLASAVRGDGDLDRLHRLMTAIRDRVAYRVGVTHTATSAVQALAAGEGVCQDHTHIFLSCARFLGFPARYVTGYLIIDDADASAAHHAWAEVRVADVGWVGFDVANGICPTDHYIRLASGLDFQDATPIRGSRRGGGEEDMSVQVTVQQTAQQQ